MNRIKSLLRCQGAVVRKDAVPVNIFKIDIVSKLLVLFIDFIWRIVVLIIVNKNSCITIGRGMIFIIISYKKSTVFRLSALLFLRNASFRV